MTEAEFEKKIIHWLRDRIAKSKYKRQLEVGSQVSILKDVTVLPSKKAHDFQLLFGFAKRDVVIHARKPLMTVEDLAVLKRSGLPLGTTQLKTKRDPVLVPLVDCEVKLGKRLISHAVITHSQITSEIKTVFPFMRSAMIIHDLQKRAQTMWRQAKGFDWIVDVKKGQLEKRLEAFWQKMLGHFHTLAETGVI